MNSKHFPAQDWQVASLSLWPICVSVDKNIRWLYLYPVEREGEREKERERGRERGREGGREGGRE